MLPARGGFEMARDDIHNQQQCALEIPPEDAELLHLRGAVDAVDAGILEKLNERAHLVKAIGGLKQGRELPVYVAARERDIVARLREHNPGPFPDEAIPHVFREIISATRSLEQTLRITYLGPEGTFSHAAALQQFGKSAQLEPEASIPAVFAAAERGQAQFAVVPVENSTEGIVAQTLDVLVTTDLTICGELRLRVTHDLWSRSGRLEAIERVASHPQPLAQCRTWLDRNLPRAEHMELASTAAAAQLAARDDRVAAIANALAGEIYGLTSVARAIEDRRDNTTRFFVLGTAAPPASGSDMTSVAFTVRKDQSGALLSLLEPFARAGINLSAIQARPLKGQPWEYLFFIDLEGHRSAPRVAKALTEAAACALFHKILGSYPRAAASMQREPQAEALP